MLIFRHFKIVAFGIVSKGFCLCPWEHVDLLFFAVQLVLFRCCVYYFLGTILTGEIIHGMVQYAKELEIGYEKVTFNFCSCKTGLRILTQGPCLSHTLSSVRPIIIIYFKKVSFTTVFTSLLCTLSIKSSSSVPSIYLVFKHILSVPIILSDHASMFNYTFKPPLTNTFLPGPFC